MEKMVLMRSLYRSICRRSTVFSATAAATTSAVNHQSLRHLHFSPQSFSASPRNAITGTSIVFLFYLGILKSAYTCRICYRIMLFSSIWLMGIRFFMGRFWIGDSAFSMMYILSGYFQSIHHISTKAPNFDGIGPMVFFLWYTWMVFWTVSWGSIRNSLSTSEVVP